MINDFLNRNPVFRAGGRANLGRRRLFPRSAVGRRRKRRRGNGKGFAGEEGRKKKKKKKKPREGRQREDRQRGPALLR